MRSAIILFAKAPIAGNVKTRLQRTLGARATLDLHRAFVLDMLDKLLQLKDVADIEYHTDTLNDVSAPPEVTRALQSPGDLGLKMIHAFSSVLSKGCPQACIVGSDSPTLPVDHLRDILSSAADVALGPSEDGGYYAIACRRVHAEMFRGVRWSTKDVCTQTEAAARNCGLRVERRQTWWDVDEPGDLVRLMAVADLPTHTDAWRRQYAPLPISLH